MKISIKEFLKSFNRTYSAFDEQTGEWTPIDIEYFEKQRELLKRAKENGKKNIPKPSQKTKDAIASEIDGFLTSCISDGKTKLVNRTETIDVLNDGQVDKRPQSEMYTEYETASTELKTNIITGLNRLFNKKRDLKNMELEYIDFKKKNKLIGPAKYKEQNSLVTHYGILFLILISEIFFNAYSLKDVHPRGMQGIIVETLVFAAINFFFGYLLGSHFYKDIRHIDLFRKLKGYFFIFFITIFLIYFNAFFGHYRDVLQLLDLDKLRIMKEGIFDPVKIVSENLSVGIKAKDNLLENGFSLNGIKSYLLSIIGLICSLLAAIKFYTADDPYPGYGKLQRDRDRFTKDFSDDVEGLLQDTNDIADTLRDELSGGTYNEAAANRDIGRRNREIKALIKKYKNWISSVKSSGETLYARYREENLKNRKDNKSPTAFNIDYVLPADAFDIEEDVIKTTDNSKSNNQLAKELSTKIKSELDSYHNTIKSVQNISAEEFAMDQLDKKISEIEKVKQHKPEIDNLDFSNKKQSVDKAENKKPIKAEEEENLENKLYKEAKGIKNIKEF